MCAAVMVIEFSGDGMREIESRAAT